MGKNWEIGIAIHTLLIPCIKQITNETIRYCTGSSTECSVVTYMGRNSKKEGLLLTHFVVQHKLTQHCKAIILP